eukprot:NODE_2454_length_536_cov_185.613963_g1950_i0.p1 GENE.NODE_2454_length_536_cov_185.613963_g1950_i0~~NODE_2454_length_536_cov_185.613963_g1950_i0.p1  ORF type:complete len:118 (-),score=7.47 NODE_2454_length_536_cov_185.613963_g1950_i0:114-467(-)
MLRGAFLLTFVVVALGSDCSDFSSNCTKCIDETSFGAHKCTYCYDDRNCHAVGSTKNNCEKEWCSSKATASTCKLNNCRGCVFPTCNGVTCCGHLLNMNNGCLCTDYCGYPCPYSSA